jgi:hypothetical protein
MKYEIKRTGFGFSRHILTIDTFFRNIPGTRLLRISLDTVEFSAAPMTECAEIEEKLMELLNEKK